MSTTLYDKNIFTRMKSIIGVMVLSIVVIVIALYSINLHYEKSRLEEKNIRIIEYQLALAKEYASKMYSLSGDLEEIQISVNEENHEAAEKIKKIRMEFNKNTDDIYKKLNDIHNISQTLHEVARIILDVHLIEFADAKDGGSYNSFKPNLYYLILFVVVLTLVASFIIILTSKDESKIKSSQENIKLILSATLGLIGGTTIH